MCLNPMPFKRLPHGGIKILRELDSSKLVSLDGIDGFLPCHKCVECQIQYSNEWALRCCQEMKYHSCACFVTLTYNDAHLPSDGVSKRDIQLFIKRLRKDNVKLRYFACGEYGSKGLRPHYHLILFGWNPHDLIPLWKDDTGNQLYTSEYLIDKWQARGYVSVGLSYDMKSIKYCCKYLQKSLSKDIIKLGLTPSFVLMSRKPMLGVRSEDLDVFSPFEYYNGCKYSKPTAYKRKIPPFLIEHTFSRPTSLDILEEKKHKIDIVLKKTIV